MKGFGILLIAVGVVVTVAATLLLLDSGDPTRAWILGWSGVVALLAGMGCIVGAKDPAPAQETAGTFESKEDDSVPTDLVEQAINDEAVRVEQADRGEPAIDSKMPIYLLIAEERKGPYLISQIRKMWDSGAITADALYWNEGMEEWRDLCSLVEAETKPLYVPQPIAQSAAKVSKVTFESRKAAFSGTMPLMVKLAMRAIQDLGWRLENVNDSIGLVTFRTGISMGSWSGVTCSLNIEEVTEGWFSVTGTGHQNISGRQLAALDFGEAQRKAQKVIERMKTIAS